MDKNGVLTISEWTKGQADSPYIGFDTMRNLDVTSTPGVAKISYRTVLNLSTDGIPVARVVAQNGDRYVLVYQPAGTSKLYKNEVFLTDVAGAARDMVEYKGYIIVSSGSTLSAYGTTTPTAYFAGWQTGLDSNQYLKLVVSRSDGFLYIANGANIKRISAFAAGSFAVAPTATFDIAITLPDGYYATTMAELGSRLMVGTGNSNSWALRVNSTIAAIFPYRIGVSATKFEDPIVISNANCVQQLYVSNGLMYISAGVKGNIYVSNGTQYTKIRVLPFYNRDEYGLSVSYYPNAITIGNNGNLLIGTSSEYGSSENEQHGIYEINLATGNYEANLKYTLSTGNYYGTIVIGFVQQVSPDDVYFGWQDGATYGMDKTGIPKYTGYKAVFESPVYRVGNDLNPHNFEHLEIAFGKPLTTEQGIKLYYRLDTISSWNLIGTWDYSTVGGVISIRDESGIPDAVLLQIRGELTAFSDLGGIPAYDNVELLSITLW